MHDQSTPAIEPLFVDIPAGAAAISVSRGQMYKLINAGEIRRVKIGSRALISVAELREYAARLAGQHEPIA